MKPIQYFLNVLLLLCIVFSAKAADIKLITIGPGDEFWSAFGHTALTIDQQVYGFGYFSFEDEGLIQAFVSNEMMYDLGVSDLNEEFRLAQWQNRTFTVQDLVLSQDDKTTLIDYLKWHNLPENQTYPYDYFLNNCSTKIRDIINQVTHGQFKQLSMQLSDQSYFDLTFPAQNQSLMNLGLALAYGWPAYQNRTDWELMAFPVYLQNQTMLLGGEFVKSTNTYYERKPESQFIRFLQTHAALIALTLILLLSIGVKLTRFFSINLWLIIQSFIGLVIFYFAVFSGHHVMSLNHNILLFSPFAFLALRYKWAVYYLAISYVLWLLLAVILSAWYLIPMAVIQLIIIRMLFKTDRFQVTE